MTLFSISIFLCSKLAVVLSIIGKKIKVSHFPLKKIITVSHFPLITIEALLAVVHMMGNSLGMRKHTLYIVSHFAMSAEQNIAGFEISN